MRYLTHWREYISGARANIGTASEGVLPAQAQERWIPGGGLVLLLVLIFWRAPTLLLEPRLWAEEASIFLRYAYTHDFLDSLLFVSHAGYFSIACTLPATIAAHLFPLAYAPVVTTYFSLGFLLLLFALILWGHSTVWDTLGKKILACLIILFAASSVGEVWLNTINIMSYGAIMSACLLLEDLREVSPRRRWYYRLLLGFCGLTAVYTTFLGGMFLLKAWLERSRESLIHVGIVACTSLIQATVFLHLYFSSRVSSTKLASLNPGRTVKQLFFSHVAVPLLGHEWGQQVSLSLGVFIGPPRYPVMTALTLLAGLLALAYLCVVLFTILPRARQHTQILLLGSYAFIATGTAIFSMHGIPAGRYAVASGVFLLWMLLNTLRAPLLSNPRSLCAAGLLACALVIGVFEYRTHGAQQYFICGEGCPKWPDELKRCETTGDCLLTVWPYPRWKFRWPNPPATATSGKPVS
jgi:hypothetical protein